MKPILLLCLLTLAFFSASGQHHRVTLKVVDAEELPIEFATLSLGDGKGYTSDKNGCAHLVVKNGPLAVHTSHLSYTPQEVQFDVRSDTTLYIPLAAKSMAVDQVQVTAKRTGSSQSLETIGVSRLQLQELQGNTLMAKLDNLPGVAAMEIGQGFSKPVIRGLTANRVAVAENGIKQQGQQWGMDHGLEIDPQAVEQITVIKGPASLEYGSDAIGGVVVISPRSETEDTHESSVVMNAHSNNDLLGGSAGTFYQRNRRFIKARASYQNYGDYRVPADSFTYLGYTMPIHDRRLKNTAGRDNSFLLSGGIKGRRVESSLTASHVFARMGFFPGAHGIPGRGSLTPDGNNRNIDPPYQSVNHLKVISNNRILGNNRQFWNLDFAYQLNHRQEHALPHSHGSRPLPESTLELDLRLQTITGNVKWKKYFSDRLHLTGGIQTESQQNRIGGYSFLLPRFDQFTAGLFSLANYAVSERFTLTAGVRYDYGTIQITGHTDDYILEGFERAVALNRSFGNSSFSVGGSYRATEQIDLKLNLGKSFRMPTANELASNGVHHGTFRYEMGNPNLPAETAYQVDATATFTNHLLSFSLSGFTTYFDHYIYLDPTGKYSITLPGGESVLLPDVGQIYRYTSGQTLRWGGEADLKVNLSRWLTLQSVGEYVRAEDIEHGYPIPFTLPLRITNTLEAITCGKLSRLVSAGKVALVHRYNGAQERVRNEETTPASHLFDLLLKSDFSLHKTNATLVVGLNNIFNTKYFNHISFYRYLGLPEAGRNVTISLLFTFN